MLNLNSNEGRVVRSPTPPNVAANPRYKNYIWIKEANPPSLQVYNQNTGLWVCDSCNPYDGTVLPQLANVEFGPVDGTLTDGFSFTHPTAGAVIWYSINGGAFTQYVGGTVRFGNPDYMYVAAFAVKTGYRDSDTVVVEYGQN